MKNTTEREEDVETSPSEDQQDKKATLKRKPSFLMRKLKLRGRRSSAVDSTETLEKEKRATPEGDDNFSAAKSVSDPDLTETSWKSDLKVSGDGGGSAAAPASTAGFLERTKSLEDLKSAMPAFGELILDPSTVPVTMST